MLSLKTIILKYFLVCVFLVSPCCVHRDRRPDQTVSVVPSPRFVLFVFSSVLFVPVFLSLMLAVRGSLRRRSRLSHPAVRGTSCPAVRGSLRRRSRLSHPAVRGSSRRRSRLSHPAVRGSCRRRSRLCHPAVCGSSSRRSRLCHPAVRGSSRRPFADQPALSSLEMTPPSTANPSPPACL